MATVHVMYDGQSHDIELEALIPIQDRAALGISPDSQLTTTNITADQIRNSLASHFDKPVSEFEDLVVEFHKNGNATVRPNATFG